MRHREQEGTVAVEIGGRTYTATYTVSGRRPVLRVTSGFGSKATQLGGMEPEELARVLLSELVEEQLGREGSE